MIDKELIQDEIDRLNSAVNYVESILYEGDHSIDEAVMISSKRFDVSTKDIYSNLG